MAILSSNPGTPGVLHRSFSSSKSIFLLYIKFNLEKEEYLIKLDNLDNMKKKSKICPVCKREFEIRKKWNKIWDQVIYCSKKCRRNKN